jgi:hypothetical protein
MRESIGTGRCTDFTAPNRTLEEFDFYQIVRTTDPEIKGLTLDEPLKLQPLILDLVEKVFVGPSEVSTPSAGEPQPSGEGHGDGPSFSRSGFERAGILRDSEVRSMRTEIAAGLRDLRNDSGGIRPDILANIALDADSFNPKDLLTAHRQTSFQQMRELLEFTRKKVPGRAELRADNPVDWDNTPTFYQATTIAHGHILHLKQSWHADGYSLGDLLHSLPLAPCQKKQIAVIDWERRETAMRSEELTEEEQLAATLSRDRDISEIVSTVLAERMKAGSWARTWSAAGGLGLGFIGSGFAGVLGVSGGAGGSKSGAWQDSSRDLAANSLQQLRDRTTQSAAAVRSQRATVVQAVGEGEAMRVQTEVVANHNHCHAITIQHFEVLRHFLISQELVDVQECLFVPLLMTQFDESKALRWKEPLSQFLRDRALLRGFEALDRMKANYEGSNLPDGSYAKDGILSLDGELRVTFNIARPRDPSEQEMLSDDLRTNYFNTVWSFWHFLLPDRSSEQTYNSYLRNQQNRDRIFQEQLAPQIADAFVKKIVVKLVDGTTPFDTSADPTLVSDYRSGVPLYVRLSGMRTAQVLRREQVSQVRISTTQELPPYSKVIVNSAYLRYRSAHITHTLYSGEPEDGLATGNDVPLDTAPDEFELQDPRRDDLEISRRLLAHLNDNIEYYHRVIWGTMDSDRRYMLLDGFDAPNSGRRSVASVVENRLIGIVGNCLVLPVARGYQLDPTYDSAKDRSLLDLYAPLTPIPSTRVSVPTRGVFAEAVMGSCNSCEEIDETRFWRWEESPCPDDPTPISGVSAEGRRSEPPDLGASPLPPPIINLQNAPAAPDPTGLAAAIGAVSNPNLFRDITGLTENQRNALAALQSAFTTAQSFGQEAAKLVQAQALSRNIKSIMNTIGEQEKQGNINPDQAQELRMKALNGLLGSAGGDSAKPMNTDDVSEVANTAGANKASVSVSRPNGERVEVNARPETAPTRRLMRLTRDGTVEVDDSSAVSSGLGLLQTPQDAGVPLPGGVPEEVHVELSLSHPSTLRVLSPREPLQFSFKINTETGDPVDETEIVVKTDSGILHRTKSTSTYTETGEHTWEWDGVDAAGLTRPFET